MKQKRTRTESPPTTVDLGAAVPCWLGKEWTEGDGKVDYRQPPDARLAIQRRMRRRTRRVACCGFQVPSQRRHQVEQTVIVFGIGWCRGQGPARQVFLAAKLDFLTVIEVLNDDVLLILGQGVCWHPEFLPCRGCHRHRCCWGSRRRHRARGERRESPRLDSSQVNMIVCDSHQKIAGRNRLPQQCYHFISAGHWKSLGIARGLSVWVLPGSHRRVP